MTKRFQVWNNQTGKLLFETNNHRLANVIAFHIQDNLERDGLDSTFVGVVDTTHSTRRFISQVIK